ncbi:MAG TPA: hypothetical protein VJ550_11630 [Geomonas sp.]|nr:hypothetical protein [Geomonas sp.]
MSKRGKLKKAENVEKRRQQMEEALECLAVKQAAESQMGFVPKKKPKQCSFRYCQRYVDPSCTVCPYCGNPLDGAEPAGASFSFQGVALQGC